MLKFKIESCDTEEGFEIIEIPEVIFWDGSEAYFSQVLPVLENCQETDAIKELFEQQEYKKCHIALAAYIEKNDLPRRIFYDTAMEYGVIIPYKWGFESIGYHEYIG